MKWDGEGGGRTKAAKPIENEMPKGGKTVTVPEIIFKIL